MKINTITCHDVYNHGASLQACALQHYLQSEGHDVEIIHYKPDYLSRHFNLWMVANPIFDKPIVKQLYLLAKLPGRLCSLKREASFDAFTAKSNLEKLDLSKQNNFGKSYKNTITKIFNSVPKLKEIVEMSETTEQDIKSIEQPDQESLENNAVISDTVLEEENKLEEEKSIVKKSRKKTKNVE